MFVRSVVGRFGNLHAIHNARLASIELSRRRVEREAVEIFLRDLAEMTTRPGDGADAAVVER